MAAIEEQGLALFRIAKRSMAAFFGKIVGFGFDNACAEPEGPVPMADDLAEQVLGQGLGITIEKRIGQ
ncbi:hypothetical protein D9M71_541560 [compost metagenome]